MKGRDGICRPPAGGAATAACLLGRRRCRSRDSRHGRDVTTDHEGRRVGRITGGDGRLTDGGETSIVINDVRRLRRGHGEHRLALTGCGPPCRATRSNRDFLLAITGIIAHKHQFSATSVRRECITNWGSRSVVIHCNHCGCVGTGVRLPTSTPAAVRRAHRGQCNENVDFLLAITSRRSSLATPSNLGTRLPLGLPPVSA